MARIIFSNIVDLLSFVLCLKCVKHVFWCLLSIRSWMDRDGICGFIVYFFSSIALLILVFVWSSYFICYCLNVVFIFQVMLLTGFIVALFFFVHNNKVTKLKIVSKLCHKIMMHSHTSTRMNEKSNQKGLFGGGDGKRCCGFISFDVWCSALCRIEICSWSFVVCVCVFFRCTCKMCVFFLFLKLFRQSWVCLGLPILYVPSCICLNLLSFLSLVVKHKRTIFHIQTKWMEEKDTFSIFIHCYFDC